MYLYITECDCVKNNKKEPKATERTSFVVASNPADIDKEQKSFIKRQFISDLDPTGMNRRKETKSLMMNGKIAMH